MLSPSWLKTFLGKDLHILHPEIIPGESLSSAWSLGPDTFRTDLIVKSCAPEDLESHQSLLLFQHHSCKEVVLQWQDHCINSSAPSKPSAAANHQHWHQWFKWTHRKLHRDLSFGRRLLAAVWVKRSRNLTFSEKWRQCWSSCIPDLPDRNPEDPWIQTFRRSHGEGELSSGRSLRLGSDVSSDF